MHKIGADVHLLQGLCLHQKAPAMSTSITGFCTASTIGECLLQFCPFFPQSVVLGSPISLSIRHSQYTPRQARPIMEDSVCSI